MEINRVKKTPNSQLCIFERIIMTTIKQILMGIQNLEFRIQNLEN